MMVVAIVGAEVAFWVVLVAGLVARYVFGRRRLGGWVLAGVPLVDLVLLVLTVADLRAGAQPEVAHGLAALYLGFSVAFGSELVRWADVRVAHRFAGGPAPAPKPAGGTAARLRLEWVRYGRAVLGAGIAAALLLAATALVGPDVDTDPLLRWIPSLGLVLAVWGLGWPVVETIRFLTARSSTHPSTADLSADRSHTPATTRENG